MTTAHSAHFFGKLYDRMAEDLHLAGMSERTHAGYLRAVRQLADYCKTPPAKISEDQLRRYFLHQITSEGLLSGRFVSRSQESSSFTPGPAIATGTHLPK
jgi:hypothetical protein